MTVWEAILFGILGGATELLPISFAGHSALLRSAFRLSPFSEGEGCFVRAAICLGVMAAIVLAFPEETRETALALRKRRGRRRDASERLRRRSVFLGAVALVPMLCSLFFTVAAERVERLPFVAVFFALNGLLLFFCCRIREGRKTEKTVLLSDTVSVGLARAVSVFPGLSAVGSSLCVGRARGLSRRYNLKLTYLLTLFYEAAAFLYYLIRAFFCGSFTGMTILSVLLAFLFSGVAGYFALQYFRYLLNRNSAHVFAYYCWDAAVIALILALING